jgi:hypothetical protein
MNDPKYPRPCSIGPKIVLAQVARYVVLDRQSNLHWTGQNGWGKECDARIYSSLHDALESVRLLKYRCRWDSLMDPGPESWN